MAKSELTVTSAAELASAVASGVEVIRVGRTITGSGMITLKPGVTLRGGTLVFTGKGIRLTRDNTLEGVTVRTVDSEVAVLNDTSVEDFGTLTLRNVVTRGQVQILAEDRVRAGHVAMDTVHVESADLRGRSHRPALPGIEIVPGAITVWNRTGDPAVALTAELRNLSAGSAATPIRGSGVMVGGTGGFGSRGDGGIVRVSELTTGDVHIDGGIVENTPDVIAGGVFVTASGEVRTVTNTGTVTTHGPNDMVLDNWGVVKTWTARKAITSTGPSGIGFVNFGELDLLDVQGPIRTSGSGARGFNLYDGSLREARFVSIETGGDGSVGIQVSKPLGSILVSGDVTTRGGEGLSLVKGVQVPLKAAAISVKAGGDIGRVQIDGRLATSGDAVTTLEVDGHIGELSVTGGITATGQGSDAVRLGGNGPSLDGITVTSAHGRGIVRTPDATAA